MRVINLIVVCDHDLICLLVPQHSIQVMSAPVALQTNTEVQLSTRTVAGLCLFLFVLREAKGTSPLLIPILRDPPRLSRLQLNMPPETRCGRTWTLSNGRSFGNVRVACCAKMWLRVQLGPPGSCPFTIVFGEGSPTKKRLQKKRAPLF